MNHLAHSRKIRLALVLLPVTVIIALAYGTWRNPDFWRTPDQRGDHLMREKQFKQAAAAYDDPWHMGVAQYRNGDFEDAAHTFARVPGADGAFNQGNAWLMHGDYSAAVKSYDRALGFRPGWQAAEDNKALALARQQVIDDAGADRDQESAEAYKPDDTVEDQQGRDQNQNRDPNDMNSQAMSDEALRATWLRQVQTTPGDFLRAKFAFQAAHDDPAQATEAETQ